MILRKEKHDIKIFLVVRSDAQCYLRKINLLLIFLQYKYQVHTSIVLKKNL
jgi:hypothetical protein